MNGIPSASVAASSYDDLSEEMRLHLEERIEQLIGRGPESARGAKASARRIW